MGTSKGGIITPAGEPTKEINAPKVVTADGKKLVHKDAVVESLQSPGLPVKVTSGKLGPSASYKARNWGYDSVLGFSLQLNENNFRNQIYEAGEQAGDILIISGEFGMESEQSSVNFISEKNVSRLFYYCSGFSGHEVSFLGMWEITSAPIKVDDVVIKLGDDFDGEGHDGISIVMRGLTEFS